MPPRSSRSNENEGVVSSEVQAGGPGASTTPEVVATDLRAIRYRVLGAKPFCGVKVSVEAVVKASVPGTGGAISSTVFASAAAGKLVASITGAASSTTSRSGISPSLPCALISGCKSPERSGCANAVGPPVGAWEDRVPAAGVAAPGVPAQEPPQPPTRTSGMARDTARERRRPDGMRRPATIVLMRPSLRVRPATLATRALQGQRESARRA